ncbi:MAG: ankyrin [Chlamydiales bacterium]|jgi:hypothetical protein|nr:ankyrin [Chlamydiales bacterium]
MDSIYNGKNFSNSHSLDKDLWVKQLRFYHQILDEQQDLWKGAHALPLIQNYVISIEKSVQEIFSLVMRDSSCQSHYSEALLLKDQIVEKIAQILPEEALQAGQKASALAVSSLSKTEGAALDFPLQSLIQAILDKDVFLFERALALKMDLNREDKGANTPLLLATVIGNLAFIEPLIAHGASPNFKNRAGYSPLQAAVKRGNLTLTRLFLEKGGDPCQIDAGGNTLLMNAVRQGSLEMVQLLLESGADLNQRVEDKSAFKVALDCGRRTMIQFFLGLNLKVSCEEYEQASLLEFWGLLYQISKAGSL